MTATLLFNVLMTSVFLISISRVIDPVEAFCTKTSLRRPSVQVRYRGQDQDADTVFPERRKGLCSTKDMGYNALFRRNERQSQQRSALGRFRFLWRQFRKLLYRLIHRTTVYVLALDNDKYYVGSTTNPRRRFREHFGDPRSRSGSRWTRLHRPVYVEALIRRVPERFLVGVEAQVTAEYMLKYGVNNVRGAYFTHPRNYTLDDVSILTGFLGHYGSLDFKLLEKKLEKTLPPPSSAAIRRSYHAERLNLPLMSNNLMENRLAALKSPKRLSRNGSRRSTYNDDGQNNNKKNDVCFHCGRLGHWANECPDRSSGNSYSNIGRNLDSRRSVTPGDSDERFLRSVLNGQENNRPNDIDDQEAS